jgi:hypothetical protein
MRKSHFGIRSYIHTFPRATYQVTLHDKIMPVYHTLINVCGVTSREHLGTLSDELMMSRYIIINMVWRKHIHYTTGSVNKLHFIAVQLAAHHYSDFCSTTLKNLGFSGFCQ